MPGLQSDALYFFGPDLLPLAWQRWAESYGVRVAKIISFMT
jgi:hypothetical protein